MPLKYAAQNPRKVLALAVAGLLILAAGAWILHSTVGFGAIMEKLKALAQWCADLNPAMYVAAVAVLPYVGVPSSFLYPLAGNAYGVGMGIVWTAAGIALNLPLGYFIGTRLLRGPIERWMERRGRRLPEVPRDEMKMLIVFTRILPGPPLIAQNFLLALAEVPFLTYYLLSLPICVLLASGLIIASSGLVHGNIMVLVTGVCAIVALALLAHFANRFYKTRKQKSQNLAPPG